MKETSMIEEKVREELTRTHNREWLFSYLDRYTLKLAGVNLELDNASIMEETICRFRDDYITIKALLTTRAYGLGQLAYINGILRMVDDCSGAAILQGKGVMVVRLRDASKRQVLDLLESMAKIAEYKERLIPFSPVWVCDD